MLIHVLTSANGTPEPVTESMLGGGGGASNITQVGGTTLNAADTAAGLLPTRAYGLLVNPTSTLTRPSDTTAYAQSDLIASSTTAGSIVVPSVSVLRVAAGNGAMRRIRLLTNKTSGWDATPFTVRFWSTAPTYTNGDNGAYAVATGAAGWLGQFGVSLNQFADGATGAGVPAIGSELGIALASGQVVFWDLQYVGAAALTPASAQTFTLIPEFYQN